MSTNFITFHPATLSTACAAARRKPDPNNSNIRSTSSTSWFTPLFGWPNTPDYINSVAPDLTADPEPVTADPVTKSKKFVLGKFTDEKAKQLRMMTTGKDAFHDVMYDVSLSHCFETGF